MIEQPPTSAEPDDPGPPDPVGDRTDDTRGPINRPEPLPEATPAEGSAAPDLDLLGNPPRGRPDWSHRRGEPRIFALCWTLFLTVITTTMLMRAAVGGRLDLSVYRQGLRMTLLVIMTAVVIAWPMMRLSQARPRGGGVGSMLKDLLIVLVPLQAVLWPQVVLARWPVSLVGAIDALLAAWALVCGGIVAIALGGPTEDPRGLPEAEATTPDRARGRIAAMSIVVALSCVGGAAALALDGAMRPIGATDAGSWWMMLSPHAGVLEMSRDRAASGEAPHPEPAHLWAIGGLLVLGVATWAAAISRQRAGRGGHHPPAEVAAEARGR